MIQFNLLPDIKLEYIRARRSKRFLVLVSVLAGATAVTILTLLFLVVGVFQKKHLSDLNNDAKKYSQQLKSIPSLDKVLTVQNQLRYLPGLHDQKPVAAKVFDYISKVTPVNVSIAKLDVDFTSNTIKITGAADSIRSVNTFIDTLKFTDYKINTLPAPTKAFKDVVLASFGRDDKGASYQVNLGYDPAIFNGRYAGLAAGGDELQLQVPQQITTRSETEKPPDLFQPNSNTKEPGR